MQAIISKLDLADFVENFQDFLAREKPLFMEGDINLHYRYIKKLLNYEFKAPKPVKNLDTQLMHLKKMGTLKVYEIYEFVKIIEYFLYLKKQSFETELIDWLGKIIIPPEVLEACRYFDEKGRLKDDIDERFLSISQSLKKNKNHIKDALKRVINTQKIAPYLVDRQIHYINDNEAILVRGGFNHVIKGTVSGRSSGGFFYVTPESITNLKKQEASLLSKKDELVYEYEKRISSVFNKLLKFLNFINREFDRFDNYQARVFFAKSKKLEFIIPNHKSEIVLNNFSHPALQDPKPVSVDFSKKVLMITGVNAGGKTMLLKSILTSVFLAKYLLPMKINSAKSKIGHFKEITAIIDDPQNVKNDISTFAGRMVEFSKLFGKKSFIAGVDEIELGTDSDEAASLFKVILERLMERENKIIITTHHKRLAAMMATNEEVELAAALFDEKNQAPTYEFFYGTIGKSYAFETAQRYGISSAVIEEAKKVYGEDKEKLNDLIQKNIDLELMLRRKQKALNEDLEKNRKLQERLLNQKESADLELRKLKHEYDIKYQEAITEAKKAAKSQDSAQIHRLLNKADKKRKALDQKQQEQQPIPLKVGDKVKYGQSKGVVLSIRKNEAMIESDGVKLRVPISLLKRSGNIPPKKSSIAKVQVERPKQSSIKLDLHGLRTEEAIEKLDKFLSDALITGYDEVLVYHGIGAGILSKFVREFLETHPKVKSFSDAPANMGGFGAKVVKL